MYSPGIGNPADVLSRLPLANTTTNNRNTAEEYVQYVAQHAAPKAMSLSTIKEATNQDPVLQFLRECIMNNNWPKVSMMRPYCGIRHELTIVDDIFLRGSRLLMPTVLREQTLKLAHEGNQGIVKTKQLLREKVWWPGIDKAIEQRVPRGNHQPFSFLAATLGTRSAHHQYPHLMKYRMQFVDMIVKENRK